MTLLATLLLLAALLPYVAAVAAKAGGQRFDNNNPRAWLAAQEGWRSRANAAQANLFEGLPFFYAAVLFALYARAEPASLLGLMIAWIVLRLLYLLMYISGRGMLRSLVWALALVINIVILFSAV